METRNRRNGGARALGGVLGLWWLVAVGWVGCGGEGGRSVVVYASQDQVYAEAILKRFTRETGIEVKAVYDSEAVKTVGLANRLLAERGHPQCDLFWNNEAVRTHQLAVKEVFRETNGWAALGYRSRRLVVNTNLVSRGEFPGGLLELTNAVWKGKVALAYPLFGSTSAHFLALRRHWGEPGWEAWCEGLAANEPMLVDGNSVVVRMVGRGAAAVGLTDYDDVVMGWGGGLPVEALPLSGDLLLIPNTVGVVRGGSNPAEAQLLFEYLQRPDVVRALVDLGALEGVEMGGVGGLRGEWGRLVMDLDGVMETLKRVFLR